MPVHETFYGAEGGARPFCPFVETDVEVGVWKAHMSRVERGEVVFWVRGEARVVLNRAARSINIWEERMSILKVMV